MEEYKNQVDTRYSKQCITCGQVFYKKKCLSFKHWEERKFCSLNCRRCDLSSVDPTKFKVRYTNTDFYIRCYRCGEPIEIYTEYEFMKRKYCSKRCGKLDKNPNIKEKWTEEKRRKVSERQKRFIKEGIWINPIYKEGVIEKIKETKRTHPIKFSEERLELSSFLSAKRLVDGKNEKLGCFKYGKMGKFWSNKNNKEIFYRSSFEKRAFELLENDEEVISYEHEPFHLKYKIQNKTRYYVPDILICYKNNQKLVEIKPLAMTTTEIFFAKQESATQFCKENNMTFEVWTEVVLFPDRTKFLTESI